MSQTTIEWTQRPGTVGETWNPTTGCNKVDRGCKHCYAEIMHKRLRAMGQQKYAEPFLDGAVAHPNALDIPLSWKKPRTVFVNSMSDLFHEAISFEFIKDVLNTIRRTPQHTYLVLTKRPEVVLRYVRVRRHAVPGYRLPDNLWLGTSANDQASADKRVPLLLDVPAAVLFLSYEPATGPLDLRNIGKSGPEAWSYDALAGKFHCDGNTETGVPKLHWVICGGESGPKAAPMHPTWARQVRDDCAAARVPYFFKQWGAYEPCEPAGGPKHVKATYVYDAAGKPTRMVPTIKKSANLLDGTLHQHFPR